jgi:methionyl-tRNA formyltransferase
MASQHEVAAVLTRPDAPAGRGRRIARSAVATAAEGRGIEVLQPAGLGDTSFLRRLEQIAPECLAVVAYGQLVPPALLDRPRHGWVNLHFSLLPAWRGAAPVQRAILHGDEVTGATTFRLAEGLDTGPVFGMITEPIQPADTAGDLLARLADSGAALLLATMTGIEDGSLRAVPQSAQGVSAAPKVSVEEAEVSWAVPALHVDRLIRAYTPEPGPWTTFRGDRMKLAPVTLLPDLNLPVGRVVVEAAAVVVGTGSCAVALSEVQPPGRRWMSAVEWARGARPTDESFG